MAQEKARSPYQRYGKQPFRYSDLRGVEHQRMLINRFGADYWTVHDAQGKQVLDRDGRAIRMFAYEAYANRFSRAA